MSLGETILAIFGTRKLSTSKDYKLLDRRINTLEQNDRMLRDMLWSTMTDEQKKEFIKKYKGERTQPKHEEELTDDIGKAVKTGFWIIVGIFGGLFVLYMIVYTIVAACT